MALGGPFCNPVPVTMARSSWPHLSFVESLLPTLEQPYSLYPYHELCYYRYHFSIHPRAQIALLAPPHPMISCHIRGNKVPWSLWVTLGLGEPAGCSCRAASHSRRHEKSSGAEPSLKKHTRGAAHPRSIPPPPTDAAPPNPQLQRRGRGSAEPDMLRLPQPSL